jgi:hypothetical protein
VQTSHPGRDGWERCDHEARLARTSDRFGAQASPRSGQPRAVPRPGGAFRLTVWLRKELSGTPSAHIWRSTRPAGSAARARKGVNP